MPKPDSKTEAPKSDHRVAFLTPTPELGNQPVVVRGYPAPPEGWVAGIAVNIKRLGITTGQAKDIAAKTRLFKFKEVKE